MERHFLKTGLIAVAMLAISAGGYADTPTELETRSVALSETIKIGDRIGHIRFLGMLQLPNPTVDGMRFSQLSGLAWDDDDGILYAISDKGFLFHLQPVFENGVLTGLKILKAFHLREAGNKKPFKGTHADSEGLDILKGHNGHKGDAELIISFERFPRIVRYSPDGYATEESPLPAPLNGARMYQDSNKMLESVCVDSRLGILTVPEAPLKAEHPGYTHIFSLDGRSWIYPLPAGNRISALECLGNNRVMVLESNFSGILGRLEVFLKIATLSPDGSLTEAVPVETAVALDSGKGQQIDNFEGLARHRGNRFFLVSDDNDLFLQRSLLMYFELLDD
ncbi:MAG: esterase-like activity of phytase family protein [Sulfuricaulis sp.]|uniref:esterase-like activity of phytase family protein n=1 Tax=Sulfuricaulis sp. TaxID=2003553 RepID=UPI003C371108